MKHDTHASTVRCDACLMHHAMHLRALVCARCGAKLPAVKGCELDLIGAGACPKHPNGCPYEDGPTPSPAV